MKRFLKILKYALLTLASLVLFLVVTVIGVSAWVYTHPLETWQIVEQKFLPADLKITWDDIHLKVRHEESWSWHVQFGFAGLNIIKAQPDIQMDIDEIELVSKITLFFPLTKIDLQNFTVKSNSPLTFKTTPDPNEPKTDLRDTLKKVQSILNTTSQWQKRITIGEFSVDVNEFKYYSGAELPIVAQAQILKKKGAANRLEYEIKVNGLSKLLETVQAKGNGDLTVIGTPEPFITTTVTLKGPDMRGEIPLDLVTYGDQLQVTSKFNFEYQIRRGKWLSLSPDLLLAVNQRELHFLVLADVAGLPGPIPKIQNVRASFDLPFAKEVIDSKGELKVSAPVPLFFMNDAVRKNIQASCNCQFNSTLNFDLNSSVWIGRLLSANEQGGPAIDAALRAEDVDNAIFNARLGATAKIHHRPEGWLFEPTLDSTIHISNFKAVREILRGARVMVPAPLSVLDGHIDFKAQSPVEMTDDGDVLRINALAQLSTDLHSAKQKVALASTLRLTATAKLDAVNLEVEALINDLIVELPPLDPVRGLPKITLDSRIELKPPPPKTKSNFKITMSFRLKTAKTAAIKLLYPLADPFVPISVDYGLANKNSDGYIQIEPFAIKYLKRTVHVDSLRLKLDETETADFPIEGQFHVQQTEYKVFIRLSGTTARPNIDFTSEPYLERADVISVLLFDRTRDNLAGGDSETAGSAQAAMADRAVGLFGLWAFAATPIRSFSYNAVTKVYSATILLGDGLTAGIGTSLDQYTSLEIRKRLSKSWVLATSWSPSETNSGAGEMVLQWEKRY